MGDGDTTRRTMAASTKDRVQKHRAKLRGQGCGRLEAWITITTIEKVRQIATREKVSMWQVVQHALKTYVTGHAAAANAPRTQ